MCVPAALRALGEPQQSLQVVAIAKVREYNPALMKTLATRRVLFLTGFLMVGLCSGRAATLTGVVVDSSGAVIPKADICAYSGRHEWRAESNGRGAFQMVLPAGTYDVEARAYGFRKRIVKSLKTGRTGRTVRFTLDAVSTGDGYFAPRVTYQSAGGEAAIQGLVRGKGNAVLHDVKISISTEHDPAAGFMESRKVAERRTNDKGEFEVPNLGPGLYRLVASRKGYTDFASANLRVRPGKIAEVDFVMHAPGFICL